MASTPPETLFALAKNHLYLPPSASSDSVPTSYISELKKHLMVYEHDTNYRLTLQPGKGYGIITCLEDGCDGTLIPLVPRVGTSDGGHATGLGSLSAYRAHIVNHPTHAKSRITRVKAERGLSNSTRSTPRAASLSVKDEPVDATVPSKRRSSLASFPTFDDIPTKKMKVEEKKPALPPVKVTSATDTHHTAMSSESIEDIRVKITDVQTQMSHTQALLNKVQAKRKKTKSDYTRVRRYQAELSRLRDLKDKYTSSLPSSKTVGHAKPLSRTSSFTNQAQAVASGSNVQLSDVYGIEPFVVKTETYVPSALSAKKSVASGSGLNLQARVKTENAGSLDLANEFNYEKVQAALRAADEYDGPYDSDGDFHGRGKDYYQGPVAKADDVDKFLLAAGNAEQFDGNASVDQALKKLGLKDLFHTLPGMEVALMPHQAIGVAWMLNKEKSTDKGGVMADEMGLGKALQMISVIAANRSDDPLVKTTLIVAPLALLDQWQLEIEMKTNLDLKIHIYHGNSKAKKIDHLRKFDVVITTFSTLAHEWPDYEAEQKAREKAARRKKRDDDFVVDDSDEESDVKPKKQKKKKLGLLFHMQWYRVCIDEAQNVRNKKTRVSRAVSELDAKYRWCLTGTPIINSLSDAYGLLRFLKIRPWYDWKEFNDRIALLEKKRPDLAATRLQSIFAVTLIRRKKDSMLDGKRLIELPHKQVDLVKLQFSPEEADIYKMVETRSQEKFNRFLRAGTVLKNYHQVLVLLLRLRQICSHPALITEGCDAFIRPGEDEKSCNRKGELARATRLVSAQFVQNVKRKIKEAILERMAAEKEVLSNAYFDVKSADATIDGEECPICYDNYTDAVVTACGHVFCRECIGNVINAPAREDANEPNLYKANERPCPNCRKPVCKDMLFSRSAFEPTEAELNGDEDVEMIDSTDTEDEDEEYVGKGKGRAQPAPGRTLRKKVVKRYYDSEDDGEHEDVDDDLSDFIVEDGEDEHDKDARYVEKLKTRLSKGKGKKRANVILSDDEEDEEIIFGAKPAEPVEPEKIKMMPRFLPSTKMKHMMESIRAWSETHPDEKTLVISQWTQCLDLVSNYLTENGFLHVKYQGDMTRNKRDMSVRSFMAKDKATIMLMSLKCGGVGLNLTRANRVISLDLGWSEAIESQAFDRVHRLGQTREVLVDRLIIQDTVEDRVLALQERKKNLADGSLGEGNGKKIGRLSVKELANLFGLDHRGRVLADQ
ncbi:SNF2 family N-terminal domain-containing protein [Abortiporus biennis]|nr:SNF2 family N-terminal domain-containing protein [Abortiporus biennis]